MLIPDAKLIVIVRDPVDRAYSNWTHLWSDGLEPIGDFVTACGEEETRMAAGWAPFWQYVGLGRYGEQLQNLYRWYPREQVHVLRYKELVDAPQRDPEPDLRLPRHRAGRGGRAPEPERVHVRGADAHDPRAAGHVARRRQGRPAVPAAGVAQGQRRRCCER